MDVLTSTPAAAWLAHWHGGGHMDWGWGWPVGLLVMLAWAAAVGAAVWLAVRASRPAAPGPGERAREILAERYARGEIGTDEYRERLRELPD